MGLLGSGAGDPPDGARVQPAWRRSAGRTRSARTASGVSGNGTVVERRVWSRRSIRHDASSRSRIRGRTRLWGRYELRLLERPSRTKRIGLRTCPTNLQRQQPSPHHHHLEEEPKCLLQNVLHPCVATPARRCGVPIQSRSGLASKSTGAESRSSSHGLNVPVDATSCWNWHSYLHEPSQTHDGALTELHS